MSRPRKLFATLALLVLGSLFMVTQASAAEASFGPCGTAREVFEAGDGSTLVVAQTGVCAEYSSGVVVAKLDAAGQIDPSYGDEGVIQLGKAPLADAMVDSEGNLVVSQEHAIRRFTNQGRPDQTFGDAGLAYSTVGLGPGLEPGPDQRIFVSGFQSVGSSSVWAVTALTADGGTDPAFNGGQPVSISATVPPLTEPRWIGGPMAADDSGRLHIAYGFYPTNPDNGAYMPVIGIVRLTPAGQPDPTYGNGQGVAAIPSGGTDMPGELLSPRKVSVLDDGSALLLGNNDGDQLSSYPRKKVFLAGVGPDGGDPVGSRVLAGEFQAAGFDVTGTGDVSVAAVPTQLRGAENLLEGQLVGARLGRTGLMSPSFGDAGLVGHRVGLSASSTTVSAGPSGSMTIGGTASAERCRSPYGHGPVYCRQVVAVSRYDASGSLDRAFGRGGVVTLPALDCPAGGADGLVRCVKGKKVRPAVDVRFANRRLAKLVIELHPRKPRNGRAAPWERINLSLPKKLALKAKGIGKVKVHAGVGRSAPRVPRRFVSFRKGRITVLRAPVQTRDKVWIEIPRNAMKRYGGSIRKRKLKVKASYGPPGAVGKLFTSARIRFPR